VLQFLSDKSLLIYGGDVVVEGSISQEGLPLGNVEFVVVSLNFERLDLCVRRLQGVRLPVRSLGISVLDAFLLGCEVLVEG